MRHWVLRMTETVVFDEEEQDIELLVIVDAMTEDAMSEKFKDFMVERPCIYVQHVKHVEVEAIELDEAQWVVAAKVIPQYFEGCYKADGGLALVAPGIEVSDSIH